MTELTTHAEETVMKLINAFQGKLPEWVHEGVIDSLIKKGLAAQGPDRVLSLTSKGYEALGIPMHLVKTALTLDD